MDATVNAAICAVHIDDDVTLERWFELIRATYEQQHTGADQPDWMPFCSKLTEDAMSAGVDNHIVEQFVEHMSANDMTPLETIRQMTEVAAELPRLYREHAADADAYDEPVWNAFLPEHGARWDGTDASWEQFTTWFIYEAEQRQLTAPATGFITYAEGQSDKIAVFAEYGMTINHAAGDEAQQTPDARDFPEVKLGDSGEWVDYLEAMLTTHGF